MFLFGKVAARDFGGELSINRWSISLQHYIKQDGVDHCENFVLPDFYKLA